MIYTLYNGQATEENRRGQIFANIDADQLHGLWLTFCKQETVITAQMFCQFLTMQGHKAEIITPEILQYPQ